MKKNNSVIFKGRKDGITILLDEKAGFDEIKAALADKISDARDFFKDGKTSLTFRGRPLDEAEELELLAIITSVSDLNVIFTQNLTGELDAEILAPEAPAENVAVEASLPLPNPVENATFFQREGLRSGQSVRYAGSVVVLGDVNAGAEVVAEGNVIVMGALKGMAHAGCSGAPGCFVAAFSLMPTQIRIGDKITYLPEEYVKNNKLMKKPLYAFLRDGQIHISPIS